MTLHGPRWPHKVVAAHANQVRPGGPPTLYQSSAPKSLAKSLPARVHLTAVLHLTDDIATPTKSSALLDLASLRKTSSEHAPEEDASVGEKVLYATRVRVRSGHTQL